MRSRALALAALLLLSGSAQSIDAEENLAPLVFIHGMKGSTLETPNGKTRWITALQALGLSHPKLALPLSWEEPGPKQGHDRLLAGEVLRDIALIPGLIRSKIYSPWLDSAAKANRPFYPFAYDWRRDNFESLEKFRLFIEDVRAENGGAKVRVVAHSMGGLIAWALMNQHPEYFESLVFVETPFKGTVSFLPDMHLGIPQGLNNTILGPKVLFSFTSIYALFPEDLNRLVDKDGKSLGLDLYNVKTWTDHRLGVFLEKSTPEIETQNKTFLSIALSQAKKFRKLLNQKLSHYPPIEVVLSKSIPTIGNPMEDGPKSNQGWDFDTMPPLPGDGRITEADALPPAGIAYEKFYSNLGHSEILNDPQVIQYILRH